MEKKRSVGLIIFGILALITPILLHFGILLLFFRAITLFKLNPLGFILNRLYMLSWLIAGVGILALKIWARKLVIALSLIGILGTVFVMWIIFPLILEEKATIELMGILHCLAVSLYYLIFTFYFTRNKVKDQFK